MQTKFTLFPLAAAAAVLLGGCALHAHTPSASDERTTNAPTEHARQRISDERITLDHQAYAKQQAAIKAVNDSGANPLATYGIAKAQCWLDVSFHEYTRNDRSAFPDEALEQSREITTYLATRQSGTINPALNTPLVNNADRLRPDLWAQAEALKKHSGFACAQAQVACGEVELVHAGNEHRQQGWRHAKPYVQIAEDRLADAQRAAQGCAAPSAPPAPPPVAAPAQAPAPVVVREKIVIAAGALFKFNRSSRADLLEAGRAQLDELAIRLNKVYSRVDSIALTGHTDRLGSDAYNDKLSLERAQTVKAELVARGISAPITTAGRGKAEPLVQCEGSRTTPTLTACLQPNRRVEIEVLGARR